MNARGRIVSSSPLTWAWWHARGFANCFLLSRRPFISSSTGNLASLPCPSVSPRAKRPVLSPLRPLGQPLRHTLIALQRRPVFPSPGSQRTLLVGRCPSPPPPPSFPPLRAMIAMIIVGRDLDPFHTMQQFALASFPLLPPPRIKALLVFSRDDLVRKRPSFHDQAPFSSPWDRS